MTEFVAMLELDVWYAQAPANDLTALITTKETQRKARGGCQDQAA
jgi:hypothetical protein